MRLVDWIAFRDEGEFNEADHPRDEDGKFSKSSNRSPRTIEIKATMTALRKKLEEGARPQEVLKEAAEALAGEYECTFPGGEKGTLVFGRAFKKESVKYLYAPLGKPYPKKAQYANAMRQLEIYEYVEELIREGERNGWNHSETHHADKDFLTIWKSVKLNGRKVIVTLDAYRVSNNSNGEKTAYNMSTEGNPGFQTKKKHLGIGDSAADCRFEIIRVLAL